jgi:hypothetical protein
MPRKRAGYGVDMGALVKRAAQQLLDQRKEMQQRELSGADAGKTEYVQRAQVCVAERRCAADPRDPLKEPRIEWEVVGSMPYDLPPFRVRASAGDAANNRETLFSLLSRRFRRGIRERLMVYGLVDDPREAARLSLLVDLFPVDVLRTARQ